MLAAHQRCGSDITVAVRHVADVARYGAVAIEEDCITAFYEKGITGPGFINAGVYLLMPNLFGRLGLPDEFSFEHDILARYVRDLRIGAFPTTGRFIDIGVPGDYKLAEQILGQTGNAR
jgi:D-glycero-alpha-D-manno-heptose 1-phosphate guanylyltransferase